MFWVTDKLLISLHSVVLCQGQLLVFSLFFFFFLWFSYFRGVEPQGMYWSLSPTNGQSRDVYILLSQFVCVPHLSNHTHPRIPLQNQCYIYLPVIISRVIFSDFLDTI